jgi:hypothetical protein
MMTYFTLILDLLKKSTPNVWQHLQNLEAELYLNNMIYKWLISIFIQNTSKNNWLLIWDMLLLEGPIVLFKAAFGLFQIISKDVITLRSLEDAQMFFEKRIEEFECNDKMVFYLIIKKFDFDMETITRERDALFPQIVQGIRENGNFDDGKSKPSSSECDVDWPWCVQDVSYRHWIGDVVVYKGMNEVNINEGYLESMSDNVAKKKEYKMKEEMYEDMLIERKEHVCKSKQHCIKDVLNSNNIMHTQQHPQVNNNITQQQHHHNIEQVCKIVNDVYLGNEKKMNMPVEKDIDEEEFDAEPEPESEPQEP